MTEAIEHKPATPKYATFDTVSYVDRHGNEQEGMIDGVKAVWSCDLNREPSIVYHIRHPTYRGGGNYRPEDAITGLVKRWEHRK